MAAEVRVSRQATLAAAHPERFANNLPSPPALAVAVWINQPKEDLEKLAGTDAGAERSESTDILPQKRVALVAVG